MVTKKEAYQAFVYHGERIFTPLGNKDLNHEKLRAVWAFILDHRLYGQINALSPWEQDDLAIKVCEKAGKVF